MYCICGKEGKAGFTAMHEKDEKGRPNPFTFNYDFWVCANCMCPTRLVLEALTYGNAPANATSLLNAKGGPDGRWMLTWATTIPGERITTMIFEPYPRKVNMQDHGRDICVELWRRLDGKISAIRAGTSIDAEYEKAQATELSHIIALIMAPFYADASYVLAESMIRWTARQENRLHESPGLAETHWQPVALSVATAASVSTIKRVPLDDAKINFIKHCVSTGSQTVEVLAGMFNCSVEQIQEIVS